jgi:hypothetical protein
MLQKIKGFVIGDYSYNAQYSYILDVLEDAESDENIVSKFSTELGTLRKTFDAEDALMTLQKKTEDLTARITTLNDERKVSYLSYKRAVDAFVNITAPDMAAAATRLKKHIDAYSINVYDYMNEKTASFTNFSQDLATTYKQDLELLQLTPFATAIIDKTKLIRQLVNERDEENAKLKDNSLHAARLATDAAYQKLKSHINSYVDLNETGEFDSFISTINQKIARYKTDASRKKTINKRRKEKQNGSTANGSDKQPSATHKKKGGDTALTPADSANDAPKAGNDTPKASGTSGDDTKTELTPAPSDDTTPKSGDNPSATTTPSGDNTAPSSGDTEPMKPAQ